jgi:isopentenyl-diphosphate delta-isomerase
VGGIAGRKADHVRLALASPEPGGSPGFADVALVHDALPELDRAAVDPSTTFLGRRLELPLLIASMTGGHDDAVRINGGLAALAQRHGLAMGVGSQRAALVDRGLRASYTVARARAPSAMLLANVGAPQLVAQGERSALTTAEVLDLVEMIEADALVVHLNPLQELIQPGGDRDARGWLAAIERLAADLPVPVIAKETGGGIAEATARRIAATGAAAIDVGGRGGTSFAAIEAERARELGDERAAALGDALAEWGIPTTASIVLAGRDAGRGRQAAAPGGPRGRQCRGSLGGGVRRGARGRALPDRLARCGDPPRPAGNPRPGDACLVARLVRRRAGMKGPR